MKNVIIGTAGHVDHGKTSLIQALTGTNPDRLKEEQLRGMTIDIGFAALRLPDGTIVGIVDVPGHERFLKNMLAGATGVDVVLLVVAADESVMPQTIEHLDILRLLDVKNGVIAMTKADLVDREWADTVEADIRMHLEGSFLADAPIIRVSAVTGRGIEALKRALMSAVSRADQRNADLPFRLPIDRVFTRPGFGTVVTGTLVAGTVRVGDTVEIVPQHTDSRVRGLQVHGQKVSEAQAGSRVAINLASIDAASIARGAQVAPPGAIHPTKLFDAAVRLLPDAAKAIKDRARIRIHLGTMEILGRFLLLDQSTAMEPGGRGFAQFQGETEFACVRGDRFVIRTYSPMSTIGGGTVLDSAPGSHKKSDRSVLAALTAKERGTPYDLIETLLERRPYGILRRELASGSGLSLAEIDAGLAALMEAGRIVEAQRDRIFHRIAMDALTRRANFALEAFHTQFPLRPGMPKEELRGALGRDMDPRAFAAALAYWERQEFVVVEVAAVRLSDFKVELNERQQALLLRIEAVYREKGIQVPSLEEVSREVKAPPDAVTALIRVGIERGRFVKVDEGAFYHVDTVKQLQTLVRDYVQNQGPLTVAAFRDLTQSNRKFSMTALEYFDAIRFTRREGDTRTLFGAM